jgi:hydroxymethylbilane synthase
VATRLARLESGDIDATFLAMAGLLRLGKMPAIANPVDPDTMLPAAGQGTVALQCRVGDGAIRALLAAASDARAFAEMQAERALLATLDGSCRTPIGALARQDGGALTLDALVAAPDGSRLIRERVAGETAEAARLGEALGLSLKGQADPAWFED